MLLNIFKLHNYYIQFKKNEYNRQKTAYNELNAYAKEVKKYDVVSVYVCPEEERENVSDKIKNIDDLNKDFLKKLIANYNYKKIDLQ